MVEQSSGPEPQQSPIFKLVITDLDGTLLDHHNYSFAPALPALHQLGALNIPVIFCSSKTRAEIEVLRRKLDNCHPFIVENGAAICGLKIHDSAPGAKSGTEPDTQSPVVLGVKHAEIKRFLDYSRQTHDYRFQGFTDMTVAEVVACTGLEEADAVLAKQREYSEPLVWQDSQERLTRFVHELHQAGFNAQQGGRFLTVAGNSDKGRAVAWLRDFYGRLKNTHPLVIALGDSPNDEPMLDNADIAVVILSDKSNQLQLTNPQEIIYTQERGPAGWCSAITTILEEQKYG